MVRDRLEEARQERMRQEQRREEMRRQQVKDEQRRADIRQHQLREDRLREDRLREQIREQENNYWKNRNDRNKRKIENEEQVQNNLRDQEYLLEKMKSAHELKTAQNFQEVDLLYMTQIEIIDAIDHLNFLEWLESDPDQRGKFQYANKKALVWRRLPLVPSQGMYLSIGTKEGSRNTFLAEIKSCTYFIEENIVGVVTFMTEFERFLKEATYQTLEWPTELAVAAER